MTSDPSKSRRAYRPSGKVNWPRLLAFAAPSAVVAVLTAFGLSRLDAWSGPGMALADSAAFLLVFVAAYPAIPLGHCRNWIVAWGVLAVAGLVLTASYACLVLPPGRREPDAIHAMNVLLLCEVVCTLLAGIPAKRANRAYCETCGRWSRRVRVVVPAGIGSSLARAIAAGELSSFSEVSGVGSGVQRDYAVVELEFCPRTAGSASCPVYLSLKEQTRAGRSGGELSNFNVVLRQAELSTNELRILAGKIPALGAVLAACLPSAPEARPGEGTPDEQPSAAVVISLPPEEAATVHTVVGRVLGVLLSFTPVVLTVGGAALAAIGCCEQPWAGGLEQFAAMLAWLKLGGGGVAAVFCAFVCWTNVDFLNMRRERAAVRRILRRRNDAIVDPDDPEAIYVRVVPRGNWQGWSLAESADRGFLLFDTRRRQILFEGLRQRYRVPAEAIVACDVEPITLLGQPTSIYVTVLRARQTRSNSGGPCWEAPLVPISGAFEPYRKRHRYRRAAGLRDRIIASMGIPAANACCDEFPEEAVLPDPSVLEIWEELECGRGAEDNGIPAGSRIHARQVGQRFLLYLQPGGSRTTRDYGFAFMVFLFLATMVFGSLAATIVAGKFWELFSPPTLGKAIAFCVFSVIFSCFVAALVYDWLRARFAKTYVLLEPDRLILKRSVIGRERYEQYRLRPDSHAGLGEASSREIWFHPKGSPIQSVVVFTAGRPAKFGAFLPDAAKGWLVKRLNKYLER